MSTNRGGISRAQFSKRWTTPVVAVAIGLVCLAAGLRAGEATFAYGGLAVMLGAAAALMALSRRSETLAGLLDGRDERINRIDLEATSFAGMTLIAAVLVAFVTEIARGQDGEPYSALGTLAAVAYLTALLVLRFRR